MINPEQKSANLVMERVRRKVAIYEAMLGEVTGLSLLDLRMLAAHVDPAAALRARIAGGQ